MTTHDNVDHALPNRDILVPDSTRRHLEFDDASLRT